MHDWWSLDPSVTHLNHGSLGAVPRPVREWQDRLRAEVEDDPSAFFIGLADRIVRAREVIAPFCGSDVDGMALVPNVSAGATAVLASLPLTAEQNVVTTDHGYGAVDVAIRRTAAQHRRVHVPLDAGAEDAAARIAAGVDDRTGLVVIDQITSATARLMPVGEVVAACRERGVPVLVDGAHAPGMLAEPARAAGPDFWVGNLHKWACAPRGTGALVLAPRWRDAIRPLVASWAEDAPFPANFDRQGTQDATAWLAAPAVIELIDTVGWDGVRARNADLAERGQRIVCTALGVEPPAVPGPAPSMRLVPLPDGVATTQEDAWALQARIAERCRCLVAVTTWNGRGFLRLSAHLYNEISDYERLAAAVGPVLGQPPGQSADNAGVGLTSG